MPVPSNQSPAPSDAESVAKKKAIVERRAAGEPVAKIAEDLGVSRAYAYYILKEHRERGDSVVGRQGRGKPKDKALTAIESRALIKTLRETHPWQQGIDSGMWSEAEVKEWFLREFKRTIAVGQIRKIAIENNIRMRPLTEMEWSQIPVIPTPADKFSVPDQVPEKESTTWAVDEDMDLDAIKASVAETQKLLAKQSKKYSGSQTGIRTGKHRKQKASQQKKKKRKR